MAGKTVTTQARPDSITVAGQRPGRPFFAILIVAGLVVIGAGLRSTANIAIQPRFTGDAVGISATVAFVSLIFWAYVLGTLGALLAVPATLFLRSVLLDNSVPASWVNALVSAAPSKESHMPSTEQTDNGRRGRAEDRIRQIAQNGIGLFAIFIPSRVRSRIRSIRTQPPSPTR
jgi:hypothetical protein